ncbi:MAG TPA: GGDEF domain-containing protein [bacterium]|nr:GGDEF domain-containing protein [bacterium]
MAEAPISHTPPGPMRGLRRTHAWWAGPGIPRIEEWISLVRVVLLLTLIPALWFGIIAIPQPAVNIIIVVLGAYVIVLALGARWLALVRRTDLVIALDLLVVTLVVYISRGVSSPFLYLYYLTILEAAIRMNLRQALAASLAMAAMIILLWMRGAGPEALETTGFRLGAFIASGFFLALLLGILVQEYRAAQERVNELEFESDLASKVSGELRVDGLAGILLQAFLEITGLPKGAAYLCEDSREEGRPHTLIAADGFDWENGGVSPAHLPLPAAPAGAGGGEVIVQPCASPDGQPDEVMACVPLVHADRVRMWICGMARPPLALPDAVRRRLHRLAIQGVSALEAARLHEKVRELAATDSLTGLANRRSFFDRITAEMARGHRLGRSLSVALVDLNGFKAINDSYGHDVGDAALVRVTQVLVAGMRGSDLVARFGGDEFVLLFPETAAADVARILTRMGTMKTSISAAGGDELHLTLSWGIAGWPEDGATPEELLRTADRRLYEMKKHRYDINRLRPPQLRGTAKAGRRV